jgi:hypothetical protein
MMYYSATPSTSLQYHLQNVDMIAAVTNEKRRHIRHGKSKEKFVVEKTWVWNHTSSLSVVPLQYNLHNIILGRGGN